jgi:hypothetical protein
MTNWLCTSDYKSTIRPGVRDMVTDADETNRLAAEAAALEEVRGYLAFGFDVARLFGHRVFDHVLTNSYLKGNQVIASNGNTYIALQDVPASTALSNANYWLQDVPQLILTHDEDTAFTKGNSVMGPFGETYLVLADTTGAALDDTDTFYLRRNNLLVMITLDIALYHLHARISAKQIPEWRGMRYTEALAKLDKIRQNKMNPGLPTLDGTAAATGVITIHSNQKRNNSWYSGGGTNPATQS